MFLRILLGVACLSLMTASSAEAQLFRRLFPPRIVQPRPQFQQPRPQLQQPQLQQQRPQLQQPQQQRPQQQRPQLQRPQQQRPQVYSQNGYQGRPSASPRYRQMYVRRPDGSVVRYYPNNNGRIVQNPGGNAQVVRTPQQQDAARLATQANSNSRLTTTEGQLQAVRPPATVQRRVLNVYQQPVPSVAASAGRSVDPVGVSVMNQRTTDATVDSISPATPMPQASVASTVNSASSIPTTTSSVPTNPAPYALSLSLSDDAAPASAELPVESSSVEEPAV